MDFNSPRDEFKVLSQMSATDSPLISCVKRADGPGRAKKKKNKPKRNSSPLALQKRYSVPLRSPGLQVQSSEGVKASLKRNRSVHWLYNGLWVPHRKTRV